MTSHRGSDADARQSVRDSIQGVGPREGDGCYVWRVGQCPGNNDQEFLIFFELEEGRAIERNKSVKALLWDVNQHQGLVQDFGDHGNRRRERKGGQKCTHLELVLLPGQQRGWGHEINLYPDRRRQKHAWWHWTSFRWEN